LHHISLVGTKHRPWLTSLLARRPTKVAAIALANKIARMAWAMMAKGERYKEPVALADVAGPAACSSRPRIGPSATSGDVRFSATVGG